MGPPADIILVPSLIKPDDADDAESESLELAFCAVFCCDVF